jgi:antirestriction protein ArdC
MKGHTVFNVEQIEGLPEHYYGMPQPRTESVQRIERAENFLAATGVDFLHGLQKPRDAPCRSTTRSLSTATPLAGSGFANSLASS